MTGFIGLIFAKIASVVTTVLIAVGLVSGPTQTPQFIVEEKPITEVVIQEKTKSDQSANLLSEIEKLRKEVSDLKTQKPSVVKEFVKTVTPKTFVTPSGAIIDALGNLIKAPTPVDIAPSSVATQESLMSVFPSTSGTKKSMDKIIIEVTDKSGNILINDYQDEDGRKNVYALRLNNEYLFRVSPIDKNGEPITGDILVKMEYHQARTNNEPKELDSKNINSEGFVIFSYTPTQLPQPGLSGTGNSDGIGFDFIVEGIHSWSAGVDYIISQ